MATTNLGMIIPVPTVTLGPAWASQLNAALEVIDSHDHSSGKGLRIPASGLNINNDLDIQNHKLYNLVQTQFSSQGAALTGGANANSVHVANGNLYFTNTSGTAVQITDGGGIVAPAGSAQVFEYQSVSSNLVISPASTFVYLAVDTSVARTISLPLANAVSTGRIYIVKDISGSAYTNNITVQCQGSDLLDNSASQDLQSDLGSWTIVCDGVSNWYIS